MIVNLFDNKFEHRHDPRTAHPLRVEDVFQPDDAELLAQHGFRTFEEVESALRQGQNKTGDQTGLRANEIEIDHISDRALRRIKKIIGERSGKPL